MEHRGLAPPHFLRLPSVAVVHREGLEPSRVGLRGRCSATELPVRVARSRDEVGNLVNQLRAFRFHSHSHLSLETPRGVEPRIWCFAGTCRTVWLGSRVDWFVPRILSWPIIYLVARYPLLRIAHLLQLFSVAPSVVRTPYGSYLKQRCPEVPLIPPAEATG